MLVWIPCRIGIFAHNQRCKARLISHCWQNGLPSRAMRRHSDKWLARISYRRATAPTVAPSTSGSATIGDFTASGQSLK
jgi:hypothetical protein